jgi:polygalacturonase
MNKLCFIVSIVAWASFSSIGGYAQAKKYSWENLPVINKPVFKNDTFNIAEFGAKPDGITINTQSINTAIESCSKKGGGVVLIPAGLWLTGPIALKSNVNLHISRSALLQFSGDKNLYKLVEANFEGRKTVRNQAPISGSDLTNIAITGDGVIDGNGEVWRAVKKEKLTAGEWQQLISSGGVLDKDGKTWFPSAAYAAGEKGSDSLNLKTVEDYNVIKDFLRPNLLVLMNCKKVLLQNTTFQNSPAWCLHIIFSEHVTFDGVKVRNLPSAQNGDGIDIESCSFVEVKNSTLDCGDDGICIKSGKDEEGRRVGKPSQYIVIHHNVIYRGHGGFVIGSEMSGGAHDIFVSDCTFIGTDVGLRFKTSRGRGGIVEDIYIKNIVMHNIVHEAILFDMYYFAKAQSLAQTNGKVDIPPATVGTPQFRRFYISNLVCEGAGKAMLIRGLPEMSISEIFLNNIVIKSKKGADIVEASNIDIQNIILQCEQSAPLINIENSKNISFEKITTTKAPDVFFSVNGDRSANIKVEKTDMSSAKNKVSFRYGASASTFTTGK